MKKAIFKNAVFAATVLLLMAGGVLGCSPKKDGKNLSAKDGVQLVKAVTVGTLAPFMYVNEKDELTGTDIEIIKEVFKRLPQYKLTIDIADALQGVLSGKYDIAVNNYGYTKVRSESYYYSLPYKTSYNVYIQRPGDKPLTSLKDVSERKYKTEVEAGGLKATALEAWNEQNPNSKINIVYTDVDFMNKLQHIIDGVSDVAIDDGPIFDTLLGRFGMTGKLVKNEIDPNTENFLFPQSNTYFLLTKDEKGRALREEINTVLKEMKADGTLAKITKQFLGRDLSPKDEYMQNTVN